MEFMNMVQSSKLHFGRSFFVEVVGIARWKKCTHMFRDILIFFLLWKKNFKDDFVLHMHRANDVDKLS